MQKQTKTTLFFFFSMPPSQLPPFFRWKVGQCVIGIALVSNFSLQSNCTARDLPQRAYITTQLLNLKH